jgi:uncharacterized protein YndB with AHSA1/START domain
MTLSRERRRGGAERCTRTFHGPARLVFEGWTRPELFEPWWVPKSFGLSLVPAKWMYASEARTVWSAWL